ncbi:tetratricopeptide repeat protein [Chitinophaga skermanii]|uniref:Tetratricopeptide repeat protein n=1 Tax=Chitinophaga skermanii TaxID=331697 RepID=A0A327R5E8_9BACT|nr:ATP-binding protein [Chitinophaga skermanii]RAJ10924.1 tetratricopeptide repeat protein [Chitinophaga skermanii]
MSTEVIKQLQEAVAVSPNNVPLRLHLAQVLLQEHEFIFAEEQYRKVLELDAKNETAQLGLARTFYQQQKYSVAIVVLEQLEQQNPDHFDALLLHCRILVKENSMQEARDVYQHLLSLNPGFRDEVLDTHFRVSQQGQNASLQDDDDDEDEFSTNTSPFMLEKPDMNFADVGGMEREKQEIDLKIIKPLQFPELYKAYGKRAGGGILLYGPPGCGKTYLARATAGQINAEFINVGIHDVLDMWMGNSEKNLHALFELARASKPCVLFFDEVDALGANRNTMRNNGSNLINQFLSEMDGINANNENILIMGATNAPWNLDPAFRRPGRFDRIIFVEPPAQKGREEILKIHLKGKPVEGIDYSAIAKVTEGYSGADLKAIIDIAIEEKLLEALQSGTPSPITQKELVKATKTHRATTREWFNTARNYAMYSNESGIYDDVLKYLNIKK